MNNLIKQARPIIILLLICAALVGGIGYLMSVDSTTVDQVSLKTDAEPLPGPLPAEEIAAYQNDVSNSMNPIATLTTNFGVIELELFEDWMPITVGNFTKLADEGFYNGVKFHRVIDKFMIQAGDPNTKTDEVLRYGTGGPGYTIQDEFIKAELLSNVRGTIAMANTSQPNSGGSQFFINLIDNVGLDFDKEPLESKHPVFGRVINGMDVVDKIAQVKTGTNNLPVESVIIESITIKHN